MTFDIKNDLNIYTSKNYDNNPRFKRLVEQKLREEPDPRGWYWFDGKLRIYFINKNPVFVKVEVEGVEFPSFQWRIAPHGQTVTERVAGADLEIIAEAIGAAKYSQFRWLKKTGILEGEVRLGQAGRLLQDYLERYVLTPDQYMQALFFDPHSFFCEVMTQKCHWGNINDDLSYFFQKIFGVTVSTRDIRNTDLKVFISQLQKGTLGIKSCEKMEAFLSCIEARALDKKNTDAIYDLFLKEP